MEQQTLDKRISVATMIAKLVTFFFIVMVLLYPMIVASVVGNGSFVRGVEDVSPWLIRVVVALGALALLVAHKVSQMPIVAAKRKSATQRDPQALITAWLLSVFLGQAVRDIAATLGLFLSVVTHNLNWCTFLGVATFFMMLRNWPKRAQLDALLSDR